MAIWLRIGVLGAICGASFWAGWDWNGSRWEARFQSSLANSEQEIKLAMQEEYEQRLAEEKMVREALEDASEQQVKSIQNLQRKVSEVRALYEQAGRDPSCLDWAKQPVGCVLE